MCSSSRNIHNNISCCNYNNNNNSLSSNSSYRSIADNKVSSVSVTEGVTVEDISGSRSRDGSFLPVLRVVLCCAVRRGGSTGAGDGLVVMVVEVTEGVRMAGTILGCVGGAVGVGDGGGGTFVVSVAIQGKTGNVVSADDEGGGDAGDD